MLARTLTALDAPVRYLHTLRTALGRLPLHLAGRFTRTCWDCAAVVWRWQIQYGTGVCKRGCWPAKLEREWKG